MNKLHRPTLIAAAALLCATAVAGAQQKPLLLVKSRDWSAVTATPQRGKVCYALTKPEKMEPGSLNHGDVFFFITTWASESIRNEPSIQVGYSFKEASRVTVDVDGQKFQLFTTGEGAWLETPAEEAKLVEALKRGRRLVAVGMSGRGNETTYTFSLAGVSAAIDAAAKECR